MPSAAHPCCSGSGGIPPQTAGYTHPPATPTHSGSRACPRGPSCRPGSAARSPGPPGTRPILSLSFPTERVITSPPKILSQRPSLVTQQPKGQMSSYVLGLVTKEIQNQKCASTSIFLHDIYSEVKKILKYLGPNHTQPARNAQGGRIKARRRPSLQPRGPLRAAAEFQSIHPVMKGPGIRRYRPRTLCLKRRGKQASLNSASSQTPLSRV